MFSQLINQTMYSQPPHGSPMCQPATQPLQLHLIFIALFGQDRSSSRDFPWSGREELGRIQPKAQLLRLVRR